VSPGRCWYALDYAADAVRDFKIYRTFVTPTKIGHVASYDMPLENVVDELSTIKGHIVSMPLHFMEDENLGHPSFEINEWTSFSGPQIMKLISCRGCLYLMEYLKQNISTNKGRQIYLTNLW